jgi:hypothetical protein
MGLSALMGFCFVGAWSCTRPRWATMLVRFATKRVRPYKSCQPHKFPESHKNQPITDYESTNQP